MKAIITIDIEDKAFEYYSKQNPKALTVDLMDHVGERGGFYRPKFLSLKPMPSVKYMSLKDEHDDIIFQMGWNACLDKMLGEEE